jgi:hypothetical protein
MAGGSRNAESLNVKMREAATEERKISIYVLVDRSGNVAKFSMESKVQPDSIAASVALP